MSSMASFGEECDSGEASKGFRPMLSLEPGTERRTEISPNSPLVSIVDDDSLVLWSLARLMESCRLSGCDLRVGGGVFGVWAGLGSGVCHLGHRIAGWTDLELQLHLAAQSCDVLERVQNECAAGSAQRAQSFGHRRFLGHFA